MDFFSPHPFQLYRFEVPTRIVFVALGLIFDLDPCSPGPAHWVPARKIYTKEDDGLVTASLNF